MVGDGAGVKITCCTEKRKKLGKTEGAILFNRFRGKILVPETVKPDEGIYLEAKLPKHGLAGESNIRACAEIS